MCCRKTGKFHMGKNAFFTCSGLEWTLITNVVSKTSPAVWIS